MKVFCEALKVVVVLLIAVLLVVMGYWWHDYVMGSDREEYSEPMSLGGVGLRQLDSDWMIENSPGCQRAPLVTDAMGIVVGVADIRYPRREWGDDDYPDFSPFRIVEIVNDATDISAGYYRLSNGQWVAYGLIGTT